MKWIASALVAAVAVSGLRAADQLAAVVLPVELQLGGVLVLLMVVAGYLSILVGRTRLDGQHIAQQGLWTQRIALDDIAQLKLIEARRFGGWIASRLVVRARSGWTVTFRTADPQVLAAWRRLAYGD